MRNLIHLRRLILARTDSRLDYAGADGKGSLRYGPEGFHGNPASVAAALRKVYLARQTRAVKLAGPAIETPETTVPAVRAVVGSIAEWQLPNELKRGLFQFAHRLPPVSVRLVPLHRAGFRAMTAYMEIHRRMIHDGACMLGPYLKDARDEADLDRRLRTFLVCFCLGLIAPSRAEGGPQASTRASMIERIIRRVRGL